MLYLLNAYIDVYDIKNNNEFFNYVLPNGLRLYIIKRKLIQNPRLYYKLPEYIQNNNEIIEMLFYKYKKINKTINNYDEAMFFSKFGKPTRPNISLNLQNNENIIYNSIKNNTKLIYFFKSTVTKKIILELVRYNLSLTYLKNSSFYTDIDIILEAVKRDGAELRYVEYHLQNKKIILEAINNDGSSIQHADKKYLDDEDIILSSARTYNEVFHYSKSLADDKQFVLKVIKINGLALKYVSDRLKKNKEIILEAVKQNILSLKYILIDINFKLLKYNFYNLKNSFKYLLYKIIDNKEIVLRSVTKNGMALKYASKKLQNDREIVLKSVRNNGNALKYASKKLQNNKEIVSEAVYKNGMSLKYASKKLQNNKEITLIAVNSNILAMKIINKRFKNNKDVMLSALNIDKTYAYKTYIDIERIDIYNDLILQYYYCHYNVYNNMKILTYMIYNRPTYLCRDELHKVFKCKEYVLEILKNKRITCIDLIDVKLLSDIKIILYALINDHTCIDFILSNTQNEFIKEKLQYNY